LISSRANENRIFIDYSKAIFPWLVYENIKKKENRDHRMTASDFEIKAVSLVRYYCLLAISFSSRNLSRSRRANEERNMRKIPCKIVRKWWVRSEERGDERGEGNIHQHSITLNCKMTAKRKKNIISNHSISSIARYWVQQSLKILYLHYFVCLQL
jgi:hypothetical protein